MAKKRVRYRAIDPFDAFVNARSVDSAATVLERREERNLFAWPVMVNEALSLELYLKCLHLVRRRRRGTRTHDVCKLYDLLSKADKKRITRHFDRLVLKHPLAERMLTDGFRIDIPSVLARANGVFENQRYWHERPPLSRDLSGRAGSAGVGILIMAIMLFLLEIKPEWWQQFEDFTGGDPPFQIVPLPT